MHGATGARAGKGVFQLGAWRGLLRVNPAYTTTSGSGMPTQLTLHLIPEPLAGKDVLTAQIANTVAQSLTDRRILRIPNSSCIPASLQ